MTWQHAADSTGTGLLEGWTGVFLGSLAFIAVVAVCCFGILARIRDRKENQRSIEALRAEREQKNAPGTEGGGPTVT
ncbi:hypothetical protein FDO65_19565 [Nakamurella flava]|uniref:Uncharacterized protein n=1 Tax=Nakamurella flava TaxID=2576308 RepID=A0A4U6QAL8_9ACTN|nr:hypothetical protein [Nakamurella flava]TKV57014.1 hypothetical protein FDO65_19565 [Nakamurella flava]